VAEELERSWNEKLEQLEGLQMSLSEIAEEETRVSEKERTRILQKGENFREVWESENCTSETKKKIIRTVVEEVIMDVSNSGVMLHCIGKEDVTRISRWKSPVLVWERRRHWRIWKSFVECQFAMVMMNCTGADQIRTSDGKGKRGSEQRVYWTRRRYAISGQKRSKHDPEVLTLARAAKYCNVSQGVIKRLVDHGILKKEQVAALGALGD
jgi:hypothetical protein